MQEVLYSWEVFNPFSQQVIEKNVYLREQKNKSGLIVLITKSIVTQLRPLKEEVSSSAPRDMPLCSSLCNSSRYFNGDPNLNCNPVLHAALD